MKALGNDTCTEKKNYNINYTKKITQFPEVPSGSIIFGLPNTDDFYKYVRLNKFDTNSLPSGFFCLYKCDIYTDIPIYKSDISIVYFVHKTGGLSTINNSLHEIGEIYHTNSYIISGGYYYDGTNWSLVKTVAEDGKITITENGQECLYEKCYLAVENSSSTKNSHNIELKKMKDLLSLTN